MRFPSRGPWAAYSHFRRSIFHVVIAALMTALGTTHVSAQIVRAQSWHAVGGGDVVFGADAAYDPVNGVYLVVMNKENSDNTDGWLVGSFIDRAGNTIGSEFAIAGDVDFPRVVYSPHVSNGTGGSGGFLVTWADWFDNTIYARRVAFPGVVVGSASVVGPGYAVQELAYSVASQVFVAGWASYYAPHDASFSRLAVNGLRLDVPTLLATGDAGRSPVLWNSLTDVAWHETRNEFGILYAKRASPWTLRFARVSPAGTLLDDRVVSTIDAEPIAAVLEFSPLTGNYIALWADPLTGRITGAELSPSGEVLARGALPPSIVGGENGMALAYNRSSGTFLLLGFSQVPVKVEQIRGLELNKHGAPESSVIDVTGVPLNSNLFAPRVVGRSDAPEWLVNVGAMPHYLQIVSTSSIAGGSDLRLDGCYAPDPFAALGGGTCSNGDWLPPTTNTPAPPAPSPGGCATPDPFVALGGGTCYNGGWLPPGMPVPNAPAPPPPPPPAPSQGCATPDPFVALGGGTCYNGDWLPPGMPVPNAPAPPPPPPPAPSQGCATPDPFVALGGGTCYNGGWLPPGMPVPNAPAPPSPPPPPAPSQGCATPDPFVALGGGTCYNGGWLPPGMPVPNAPAPPPPPPPSQGCATPDPFVALGGGTCYNGGWLPPGMPVPNAPASPSAPTSGACTTPDPFTAMPELVGECRNGGWVPIDATTVTGTLARRIELENGWAVVTEATIYQIVGDVPSDLQIEGLRVVVKGRLTSDVVSAWPVLQLFSIMAQ